MTPYKLLTEGKYTTDYLRTIERKSPSNYIVF